MECDICGRPSATTYINKKYCNSCFKEINLDNELELVLEDYEFLERYMGYDIYICKTDRLNSIILFNNVFMKMCGAALQAKYWIEWKHKNDNH